MAAKQRMVKGVIEQAVADSGSISKASLLLGQSDVQGSNQEHTHKQLDREWN